MQDWINYRIQELEEKVDLWKNLSRFEEYEHRADDCYINAQSVRLKKLIETYDPQLAEHNKKKIGDFELDHLMYGEA